MRTPEAVTAAWPIVKLAWVSALSFEQIPIRSPTTKGQSSTVLTPFCFPKNIASLSVLAAWVVAVRAAPAALIPWKNGFCLRRRLRLTLSICLITLAGSSRSTSTKRPWVIITGKILELSAKTPVWIGRDSFAVTKSLTPQLTPTALTSFGLK